MPSKYDKFLESLMPVQTRQDAATPLGTAFLAQSLEYLESQPYEVLKVPLPYRTALAVTTNFPAGVANIGFKVVDYFGAAKFIANSGDDIPIVGVQMGKEVQRVGTIGQGYQVNLIELQAAQLSGIALEAEEARAAGRFIETLQDKATAIGEPSLGSSGLLNSPYPKVLTTTETFAASIASGNARKVIEALNNAMADMVQSSKGLIRPNRVVMGFDVYRLLDANLYQFNGDTSAKSILTSWLESNPYIKSIDQIVLWDYADKASATGSSRIVFYNNNPDYIDVAIPQEMVALPPQDRKLSIEVYMYSRYAGVRFKQSLAAVYLDGAV